MNPKIKLLKRELPHGAVREIHTLIKAKGLPYSYDVVSAIIRGDYFKQDVFDCALEYLEDYKAKQKKLAEINISKIKHAIAS